MADVWGLAALLFETACGNPPFECSEPIYPQLHQPAPSVHAERRLPKGLGDLIDACLKPEPGARPPVDAVLDTLERFA